MHDRMLGRMNEFLSGSKPNLLRIRMCDKRPQLVGYVAEGKGEQWCRGEGSALNFDFWWK